MAERWMIHDGHRHETEAAYEAAHGAPTRPPELHRHGKFIDRHAAESGWRDGHQHPVTGGRAPAKYDVTALRLTFLAAGGKPRSVWAEPCGDLRFWRLTAEGERTNELIIAAASDVVEMKLAKMNLHYGELEVVK